MIKWLRTLFTIKNISQENYRFFALMDYQYLFAFMGHFFYIFLFLFSKVEPVAYYGIVSCIVYIIAFFINRKGYYNAAFILGSSEIITFTVLCVIFLGWDIGFYYFLLAYIAVTFFNPIKFFLFKVMVVFVLTGVYYGLNYYSQQFSPIYYLEPIIFNLVHYTNMLVASIVLSISGFYYSKAARDAELALSETLKKVETTNKQILDSIHYAEVIQSSLLPNNDDLKPIFKDSFILWKPRDIVGGDIYQVFKIPDGVIIAIIDCTGHGVPGAFMTMLAYSVLRNIIFENNYYQPDKILKLLNTNIRSSLQNERTNEMHDNGLDAAITFIDLKNKFLQYSGAKLPLIYVENDMINIIEGEKQSIGYKNSDLNFDFKKHKIKLTNDTVIYSFSDGYIDQIGGQKGLPFGRSKLVDLISNIYQMPFEVQKEKLIKNFEEYRATNDIIDDITLIGFSVS